jgi:hypothetical protein
MCTRYVSSRERSTVRIAAKHAEVAGAETAAPRRADDIARVRAREREIAHRFEGDRSERALPRTIFVL